MSDDTIQEENRSKGGRFVPGVSGNPATQFQPGVCPNPKGRPRKDECLTSCLKEILAEENGGGKTRTWKVAKKVAALAEKGVPWAVQLAWERTEGRAVQTIENVGAGGEPMKVIVEYAKRDPIDTARVASGSGDGG